MSQMKCPRCLETGTDVKYTRTKKLGVTRRHVCKGCDGAFDTVELPVDVLEEALQGADVQDRIDAAWPEVSTEILFVEGAKKEADEQRDREAAISGTVSEVG